MKSFDEYCEVLGIDPSATSDQAKQAYRDLVKVWHPDRFAHDPRLQKKAEAKLKEINDAYEQLQLLFPTARQRKSGPTNISGVKPAGNQQKAEEAPPKPPPPEPEPVSVRWNISEWLLEWWWAIRTHMGWKGAAFVFLLLLGLIAGESKKAPIVPNSTTPQEQRSSLPPVPSHEWKHFDGGIYVHKDKDDAEIYTNVPDSIPFIKSNRREQTGGLDQIGKDLNRGATSKPGGTAKSKSDEQSSAVVSGGVVQSRSDALNKTQETVQGAQRLLALHEAELKRMTDEYERRRELYYQGLIKRDDLVQAEQAVAQTMLRIRDDKRFLAETDTALKQFEIRDKLLTETKPPK